MNLETQKVTSINQVHVTDALNAPVLGIKIKRNSQTQTVISDLKIYVDKQDKTNPSSERREYVFPLQRQLVYLYISDVQADGDQFVIKMDVENGKPVMKTFVERNVSDWIEGQRYLLSTPEVEEVDTLPIILFNGENYIYTNYDLDGMDIELFYAKNTESNKVVINSSMFYKHEIENDGEFSLDDIFFKDAFTKTENKINLEVDNASVASITSKNNAFSLDELGNLTVNSINYNNNNFQALSLYPVGSIYLSINSTNPSNFFGGTWELFGQGRTLVGVDTTQSEFNTVQKTGGEKEHTLTIGEMPTHSHSLTGNGAHTHTYTGFIQCATTSSQTYTAIAHKRYPADGEETPASMNTTGGHTHTVSNNGSSNAHNNLQPYITCYMWKRTA